MRDFFFQLGKRRLNLLRAGWLSNEFVKKVGILTGGTVVGRVVMVCSLPLATRLYTPYDFEILAVYVAILSIITVVSNFRFNMAISLPQDEETAANLLALSLLSTLVIFFVLASFVSIFPKSLSEMIGQPEFSSYEWMVPFGVVFAGGYQALQYWASRNHRFRLVAKTHVTRAIGGVGVQLSLGAYGAGSFGLLVGHFIHSGLGVISLARDVMYKDRRVMASMTPMTIKNTLLAFKQFPIYSVPEAFANSVGYHAPVIIIAAMSGPDAGYLALAIQVLAIPMALVGQSVAQVYLAEAPIRHHDGQLGEFTIQTSLTLFKIGFVVLTPLGLAAPSVFPLIFGSEWGPAGNFVLWMTPWFILQFTASPISTVLHIMGQLQYAMLLQFFGALLRVGFVLIAAYFFNTAVIEVYAISGAVFYFIYILVIFKLTQKQRRDGTS